MEILLCLHSPMRERASTLLHLTLVTINFGGRIFLKYIILENDVYSSTKIISRNENKIVLLVNLILVATNFGDN